MSSPRQRNWLELARHLAASTPNSCLGLMQAGPRIEVGAAAVLARQLTDRLHCPTLLLRLEIQPRRAGEVISSERPESLAADLDVARWKLPVRRGELTAIPMGHLAELARWKQRYRLILIDLQGVVGPWGGSVGRLCDQVWLLYSSDAQGCRRASARIERLAAAGVRIEGRIGLFYGEQSAVEATQSMAITGQAA
jgi:hypothetical protein